MANETEIALRQDLNLIMRKSGAAIIITDQGSYDHAALLLVKMIQPFRKRWKEYWQGPIQAAHQAHKVVLAKLVEEREARERAAQAAFAEEEGAPPAEIEAIVSAPSIAVAEPVAETYQKVTGISKRENWKARVTDLKKLAAAVAKGQVPANYILPNEQVLNARAKADKQTMSVPGVVPYNDFVISARGR